MQNIVAKRRNEAWRDELRRSMKAKERTDGKQNNRKTE